MRQLVNYMYMLILLFVYFEPPHSYGSGRNYFNDYRNLSYNDVSRNSAPPDNVNETAVNEIIKKIFLKNVTAATTTRSPSKPNPRRILTKTTPISIFSIGNFDESDNITTSYYSTHVENYPDYAVIAAKLKKFQGLQIRDTLPRPDLSTHTLLEPDAHQYRHLCRTEIQLITPRQIKNKANQDVRVVNYHEYEQTIRAEACGDKDSACSYSENFPDNLVPICKQNYIFRQMLTMTDSNDPDLAVDDIPIPSCCECVLEEKP